jgi:hypothetical protein
MSVQHLGKWLFPNAKALSISVYINSTQVYSNEKLKSSAIGKTDSIALKYNFAIVGGSQKDICNAKQERRQVDMLKSSVVLIFEVFMAVTMMNDIFWDVTPCGSCKSRRFGGT